MTEKQREILKSAADLFINQISQSINTCDPKIKEQLRVSLKESIAASESLDEVETKD